MKKTTTKLTIVLSIFALITAHTNCQWTQVGSDIDGEAAEDWFGNSVSISSDGTVVAIAGNKNDASGTDAGHVRVYSYNGTDWVQKGSDIDGEAAGDYFGSSVSLEPGGDLLAVGADANDGNAVNAGHVRLYSFSGSDWIQVGTDIDGDGNDEWLGSSVSMSGTTVAVGVPGNNTNGTSSGLVRVYTYQLINWVQMGNDILGSSAGDFLGTSVSLSADAQVLAIGASGSDKGYVRTYEYNGSNWVQMGSDIAGEASGDQFGRSVSINADGTLLAVGASRNDGGGTDAGHVRMFSYNGANWTQVGSDINGEKAVDYFGNSVSLSSHSTKVAVGAYLNDSGHVKTYSYKNIDWVPMGDKIVGESQFDGFGISVSLSSDGNFLAVGGTGNDGNGTDAGHVKIYTCNSFSSISETVSGNYTSPSGKLWTSSGTYTDTIPNTLGCDSIVTINLTIETLGITNINEKTLQIYPNPTNGKIAIKGVEGLNIQSIEIINIVGTVVKQIETGQKEIDMRLLPKGIYFLNIKTNLGLVTEKVMLE